MIGNRMRGGRLPARHMRWMRAVRRQGSPPPKQQKEWMVSTKTGEPIEGCRRATLQFTTSSRDRRQIEPWGFCVAG